jgi:hypothetical protein
MHPPTLVLAMLLAGTACTPRGDRGNPETMQQGRQYTAWLYGNEYNKLWDRFTPEMRQAFGSVGDLASFAGQAVKHLGAEQGKVDEQVNEAKPFHVYSRSASFDKSRHRMLIEWSLANDGAVTGLVVRPEQGESTTQ